MIVSKKLTGAALIIAALAQVLLAGSAAAATLKAGSCRSINTQSGLKYVGTYCVDYQCTVTTTLMFDTWCPYSVNI